MLSRCCINSPNCSCSAQVLTPALCPCSVSRGQPLHKSALYGGQPTAKLNNGQGIPLLALGEVLFSLQWTLFAIIRSMSHLSCSAGLYMQMKITDHPNLEGVHLHAGTWKVSATTDAGNWEAGVHPNAPLHCNLQILPAFSHVDGLCLSSALRAGQELTKANALQAGEVQTAVKNAVRLGIRHIDTGAVHRNIHASAQYLCLRLIPLRLAGAMSSSWQQAGHANTSMSDSTAVCVQPRCMATRRRLALRWSTCSLRVPSSERTYGSPPRRALSCTV